MKLKIKKFLQSIFLGKTRTPCSTQELRILFSDINVSKVIHENIKNKKSFYINKGNKIYKISNLSTLSCKK